MADASKRRSNFTAAENQALRDSINQHYDVLCGRPGEISNELRLKVWMQVVNDVNKVSTENRSLMEVKTRWKKIRYRERKANSSSLKDDTLDLQEDNDDEIEEVCLQWNSHHSNMKTSLPSLLNREQYVDCSLAAEGKIIKCHKLVLSSCSLYFDEIFSKLPYHQHPVIFLNGVQFWVVQSLVDFMYAGEVQVDQSKLQELLSVAESLQVKGLTKNIKSTPNESSKPTIGKPLPLESLPAFKSTTFNAPSTFEPTPTFIKPLEVENDNSSEKIDNDPLNLLEPVFVEEPNLKPSDNVAKSEPGVRRKYRKRKLETQPPPVLYRKGTKSRPTVKVPRQYHHDEFEIDSPDEEIDVKCEEVDLDPLDMESSSGSLNTSKNEPKTKDINKIIKFVNVKQFTLPKNSNKDPILDPKLIKIKQEDP